MSGPRTASPRPRGGSRPTIARRAALPPLALSGAEILSVVAGAGVQGDLEQWRLRGSAAELYERYLVPAVTLPWAVDLVSRVEVHRGDRLLDVACGTGVVARAAAERVGRGGRVVGLDLNPEMLAVSVRRKRWVPLRIEWCEGSALALPFAQGEFGVVLCQFGLQFFPDPLAALREMRRVLAPDGRQGGSVFARARAESGRAGALGSIGSAPWRGRLVRKAERACAC